MACKKKNDDEKRKVEVKSAENNDAELEIISLSEEQLGEIAGGTE